MMTRGRDVFHLSRHDSNEKRKLTKSFIFKLLCRASKGFMKASKAFMKPFEASQSVKIKISVDFYFNTIF